MLTRAPSFRHFITAYVSLITKLVSPICLHSHVCIKKQASALIIILLTHTKSLTIRDTQLTTMVQTIMKQSIIIKHNHSIYITSKPTKPFLRNYKDQKVRYGYELRGRGRPKKIWMNCVTNNMLEKGMDDAMTANR